MYLDGQRSKEIGRSWTIPVTRQFNNKICWVAVVIGGLGLWVFWLVWFFFFFREHRLVKYIKSCISGLKWWYISICWRLLRESIIFHALYYQIMKLFNVRPHISSILKKKLYKAGAEFTGFACRSASTWRCFIQKCLTKMQCNKVVLAATVLSVLLFTYFWFCNREIFVKILFLIQDHWEVSVRASTS